MEHDVLKSKLITSCNPELFADEALWCYCGKSFAFVSDDVQVDVSHVFYAAWKDRQ